MTIEKFEDLVAWQKARLLTSKIYAATRAGQFAKDFGLIDQIRRAAVSIGSNIAEGFERGNNKEFVTFLGIAKGSVGEVRSQLYTAYDVGYLADEEISELVELSKDISKLINGLILSLRKSAIGGMRSNRT
jgi:four helix bundle protein